MAKLSVLQGSKDFLWNPTKCQNLRATSSNDLLFLFLWLIQVHIAPSLQKEKKWNMTFRTRFLSREKCSNTAGYCTLHASWSHQAKWWSFSDQEIITFNLPQLLLVSQAEGQQIPLHFYHQLLDQRLF